MDFDSLLDTKADDVEAPKPLPAGEYTFRVERYEMDKSSQKQTPFVRYYLKPTAAGDDVDEEMLNQVNDWQQKELRATFYLTDRSMFMLRNFLEQACEIEIEGRTFKELIPEAQGCEVTGTVTIQSGQNGGQFNPDVTNLHPAE
jgi:hypothetical protein